MNPRPCYPRFWLSLICAAITSMHPAGADNEPADDSSPGATSLVFGGSKLASAVGTTSEGDTDWYRIKNTAGYNSIRFTFSYDRVDDTSFHALEILGGDLTPLDFSWTDDDVPLDTAVITLADPVPGSVYYVGVRGSTGAAATYDLEIQGQGGTPPDTWTQYYGLANYYYNLYASSGYYSYASAYYFYYSGFGNYTYHAAYGRWPEATYAYNAGLGLYYYNIYAASGDFANASYYYNYYIGYALYAYYSGYGNWKLAGYNLNYYWALAYYSYYVGFGDYSSAAFWYSYFIAQANAA